MSVLELAKALGEGIRDDQVLKEYDAAKAAFEEDTVLSGQMAEYNAHRTCLAEEFNREPEQQDKTVIEQLKAKLDELGGLIHQNEHYARFAAAQEAVQALMKQINEEITFYAFGVRPSSECTHDCATCGGCH